MTTDETPDWHARYMAQTARLAECAFALQRLRYDHAQLEAELTHRRSIITHCMSTRHLPQRIAAFLVVLLADAVFVHSQPWPMVVGVVAYLVLLWPTLFNRKSR